MNKNIYSINLPKKKLQELGKFGFLTCEEVSRDIQLLNRLGIDRRVWVERNKSKSTETCTDILRNELVRLPILSLNESLDSILKDELVPGRVVEVCGLPGSGKTQICLQLSVSAQFPHSDESNRSESIFINTNNNFSSEQLKEFAVQYQNKYQQFSDKNSDQQTQCLTPESIMEKILYIEIDTIAKLFGFLKKLNRIVENRHVRVIILDSFAYILRQVGLTNRVTTSYTILRMLFRIAQEKGILVIIINDMTTKVNLSKTYTSPSFGESFYHIINSRILLTKKTETLFNASVVKSVMNSPRDVDFCLGFE